MADQEEFDFEGRGKRSKLVRKKRGNTPDAPVKNYWEYCDNCGEKLIASRCKVVCPRCGFFRSCSEP